MTREEYDRHLENAIAAGIQKNNEGSVIDSRTQFEQWISNAPFEREIKRWPADSAAYAWPGQYQDIAVEVAWEAWQQSAETSQTELKRLRGIIDDCLDCSKASKKSDCSPLTHSPCPPR